MPPADAAAGFHLTHIITAEGAPELLDFKTRQK
jgi:hypothetical protein